ncbi:MAG: PTS IIA-like nitrogen regulatory protein PtsN [Alphaproteobacteria bacterium]|nr:PTS IIA-like nitrogen regulatory protein PtsN [Alphaproteobacteria bacterium]
MDIEEILQRDAVIANLRATSKKQLLQELSKAAASAFDVDSRLVFDILLERERLGSTGVGSGLAIPHGKLLKLKGLHGMFARLEKPVEFDAIDDQPVDLVFLLLAPEGAGADHLKALARVSRILRDRSFCEKLRGSDNPDAIYALLIQAGNAAPQQLRVAS